MRKEERQKYIVDSVRDMARSGEYSGWRITETFLHSGEYLEERSLLNDQFVRTDLIQLYMQARKGEK